MCRASTRSPTAARNCSASALTKAFGANTVNEAHFSYMRDFNIIGKPQGGVGPSLASQGFVPKADGTLRHRSARPQH